MAATELEELSPIKEPHESRAPSRSTSLEAFARAAGYLGASTPRPISQGRTGRLNSSNRLTSPMERSR